MKLNLADEAAEKMLRKLFEGATVVIRLRNGGEIEFPYETRRGLFDPSICASCGGLGSIGDGEGSLGCGDCGRDEPDQS